jgi:coenzyme F420 hydrogenase subunit beta
MGPSIRGIRDVAEKHLCLGCGACAFAQPDAIRMVDDIAQGRRPLVLVRADGREPDTAEALAACPGVALTHPDGIADGADPDLAQGWGGVLEVWEGFATDPEVRLAASSGGAATALALHAIERGGMHGVLHIRARRDVAYLNETVLSRTRAELMDATGSRYAPASPCDRLDLVTGAPGPCVFIGKPCDVAATAKLRRLRPRLDERLGLTIAIFCAGTPSTRGTLEMLEAMGISDPGSVQDVRYRGNGWPGQAEARVRDGGRLRSHTLTYDESWGRILQRHRQWRCYVCPDHTGEFADIAVGDPWYREIPEGEPGRSLVVVRTERGKRVLREAMRAGALTLERVDHSLLPASQPNLLRTRGGTWGRIVTTRLLGVATPRYRNLPMFPIWWRELTAKQRAQSLYGTAKRVFTKKLYRRRPVVALEPAQAGRSQSTPE